MINEVRNTVMAVLNKDNNGYITPTEFNLFAKQAQLELFEEYFYDYNQWLIKQNQGNGREIRLSNGGYADLPKQYAEVIDTFSQTFTVAAGANPFTLPTDWYTLNVVMYTDPATGITSQVERVKQDKILLLNNSVLTAPTKRYPAYVLNGASATATGNTITVYPSSIVTPGEITIHYVRYPLTPNWTYQLIGADGNPTFDPSAALGYQDFELPLSDSTTLVFKILQYAGVNIRESEVTQFATMEEATEDKIES